MKELTVSQQVMLESGLKLTHSKIKTKGARLRTASQELLDQQMLPIKDKPLSSGLNLIQHLKLDI